MHGGLRKVSQGVSEPVGQKLALFCHSLTFQLTVLCPGAFPTIQKRKTYFVPGSRNGFVLLIRCGEDLCEVPDGSNASKLLNLSRLHPLAPIKLAVRLWLQNNLPGQRALFAHRAFFLQTMRLRCF
jgi:hypothetical protein